MDIFKTSTGVSKVEVISPKNYLNATGKKSPYCHVNQMGKESLFAVCPLCENPIQIIGLYKSTLESGRKPYGKHCRKTIPGLAEYNETDYLDCPFSNPTWQQDDGKRKPESRIAKKMLSLLAEQFDRVIYILSKDTDIKISTALATKMLEAYIANEGWRYKTATMNNLPWVLGEVAKAYPLFGRRIRKDSELYCAIEKLCPEVLLQDDNTGSYSKVLSNGKQYVNLNFVFVDHSINVQDDHLNETIDFWVFRGRAPKIETIYRKKIQIRTDYFFNLISLPEKRSYRNQKLLEVASKILKNRLTTEV